MDPILETLRHIPPSTIGHFLDEGFLDIEIRPIFRPITLVGRALTINAPPATMGSTGGRSERAGRATCW